MICCTFERLADADGDRSITLCSSVSALQGYGSPAYAAAKAGLIGMMNTLSTPFAQRGVRLNIVAPGTIRTPLTEMLTERGGDSAWLDRKGKRVPLGRVGQPDDVAAVIEALADRMTYIAGQTITVDGGHVLTMPPVPGPRTFRSGVQSVRSRVRLRTRIRNRWHNRPFR